MASRDIIKRPIDTDTVTTTLRRRSLAREDIRALQTLLHDVGFAAELNWDTCGADGKYGSSTVEAVQAFATQEMLPSDGTRVSQALAQRLLARLEPFYGDAWATVEGEPPPTSPTLHIRTTTAGGRTAIVVSDGTAEMTLRTYKQGVYTYGN